MRPLLSNRATSLLKLARGLAYKIIFLPTRAYTIAAQGRLYSYDIMQVIEFSSVYSILALHTPGHTMESVVYMVLDKTQDNRPLKVRGQR